MDAALLIARLVLAVVFILAGVAKLSDLKGRRQSQSAGRLLGFLQADKRHRSECSA
jgi:uncharacterized membrane protein YphA (DoxX/SURF4 family)